jgi:UDP-N-acetylmuramoylalanine--D-glutamate ligase
VTGLPPAGRVLVVGLGRSGRAAAILLRRRGFEVVALDVGEVDRAELIAAGVEVRAPSSDPVPGVDLVIKSPGVPGAFAPVAAARASGAKVWSEIELAARLLPNPLIGVTGTNGKTTTTELAAHLLRSAGISAVACGNQGTALTTLVDAVDPEAWLVVECSSFQLEDVDGFHPRAAVLLNLAPDHLDRHGTLDAYGAAKLRLFESMEVSDLAILPRGFDSPPGTAARHVDQGAAGDGAAAWGAEGLHVDGLGLICPWDSVPLRGRHNRENAMAAAALVAHVGLSAAQIAAGLATFPGVAHRLETVAELAGVRFINDSKATNPEATMAALDAEPEGVHLILGGQAKGTPFGPLAEVAKSVVRCYLIGEAADEIAAALSKASVPFEISRTLDEAVRAATANAHPAEVVLLSPACASFDQFSGYADRGDAFRRAVEEGISASR